MASLEGVAEVSMLVVGIFYGREHLPLDNVLFFELAGVPHDDQPGNLGCHQIPRGTLCGGTLRSGNGTLRSGKGALLHNVA